MSNSFESTSNRRSDPRSFFESLTTSASHLVDKKSAKKHADLRNKSCKTSTDLAPEKPSDKEKETSIHLFKRRWFVLLVYSTAFMLNVVHLTLYEDLQANLIDFYYANFGAQRSLQLDKTINLMTIIHLMTNFIFLFPAVLFFEHKGFRSTLTIGCALNTLGSWIKCTSIKPNLFFFLLSGQIACGIGFCFLQACLVRLASMWFGKNEVATAISISVLSARLGTFLGNFIPPYLITKSYNNAINELNFYYLYFAIAIMSSIVYLISMFCVDDKPEMSPNLAELGKKDSENQSGEERKLRKSFSRLFCSIFKAFTTKSFIIILISFGFMIGSFDSMSYNLNQMLLQKYQSEGNLHKIVELIFLIGTIVGPIITGLIIDHTRAYKLVLIATYTLALLIMTIFWITFEITIWTSYFALFSLGLLMSAFVPVAYDYAVEVTHPVSETISSGVLNFFGIICTAAFVHLQGFLSIRFGTFYGNMFISGVLFFGVIFTVLVGKTYKRQQDCYGGLKFRSRNEEADKQKSIEEIETHE